MKQKINETKSEYFYDNREMIRRKRTLWLCYYKKNIIEKIKWNKKISKLRKCVINEFKFKVFRFKQRIYIHHKLNKNVKLYK